MLKDTSFSHDGAFNILKFYFRDELYWPDFYSLFYQFDDNQQLLLAMNGLDEVRSKIAWELVNPNFDPSGW